MRILYVASQFDYGQPGQGWSFEHVNFYDSLMRMGHELTCFDFETLMRELGRDGMNRRLREVAAETRADLMFVCLTGEQFDIATIRSITDSGETTTFNWFCDDHFRFEKFSRRWAPAFHWVSTTAECALPWYREVGLANVLKTQWGANPGIYRKLDLPLKYDVSFVGRVYRRRPAIIEHLRCEGFNVLVRGSGWPEGRATQDEMIQIFNQSRINLNFSDPPKHVNWFKRLLGRRQPPKQIKGRNFEIPACGGFLLTDHAENLEDYFAPGKEIAIFENEDDLVAKIRHYLADDTERVKIAEAGHQRTLREHTYEQRFKELFDKMGLLRRAAAQK
ncbi:MAG: glycosyltransferase [Verrucomicrobia bacterium]|nr:glycosyltransferase [Verrucomicrobiota bacterium]